MNNIFLRFFIQFSNINTIFAFGINVINSQNKKTTIIYIVMNKTELVNAIAEKANLSKVDAKNALDAALNAVAEALAANDKVALIGFGTFSVSEKGERTGLNPRTKEKIVIPARKAVKFKAGAELNAKL